MRWKDLPPRLSYAIAALILALLIGTVFYHFFEHWGWLDSALFSTSTLTTVGYGNIVPITRLGKIFTIFYMVIGIGIALYALSLIGVYYVDQRVEQRALHVATRPREHIQKLKCMITPKSDDCKTPKKQKLLVEKTK